MRNILLAGAVGLWATSAFAHSALDTTVPADGAILSKPPSEIVLEFKGNIRLTRVTFTYAGEQATDMDLGENTSFASDFTFPFEGMGIGEYVINFRGLGTDGHVLNGTFSFTLE